MGLLSAFADPYALETCRRPRTHRLRPDPASKSGDITDPLLTISQATGRNRRQRFSLVSAVFGAGRFAADCHRLQPRGSIKAPYLRARIRVRSRGLMRFTLSNLKALIPSFLHCRWKGVVGVLRDASSAAQREGDPTFGRRKTVRAGGRGRRCGWAASGDEVRSDGVWRFPVAEHPAERRAQGERCALQRARAGRDVGRCRSARRRLRRAGPLARQTARSSCTISPR